MDKDKILKTISECDDPKKLRTWIENARNKDNEEIAQAAFRRLISGKQYMPSNMLSQKKEEEPRD